MNTVKDAAETLVHYSRNPHEELRPLTYAELVKDRTSGRWVDQPDKAQQYVTGRRRFESALHRRLAQRGIAHPRDASFLYATLGGKEQLGWIDVHRHEAPLTDDVVNRSFFDVVGDGKSRVTYGPKGLAAVMKRWRQAQAAGGLKETEYMGMPIRPRVEVITPSTIRPTAITPPQQKEAAEEPITDNPYREAKRFSDLGSRGSADAYAQKADILRKLIIANPDQWKVDDHSHPYVVGITHTSGWRYHLPSYALQGTPIAGYQPKQPVVG